MKGAGALCPRRDFKRLFFQSSHANVSGRNVGGAFLLVTFDLFFSWSLPENFGAVDVFSLMTSFFNSHRLFFFFFFAAVLHVADDI